MLPRLQAEETLDRVTAAALGAGGLKDRERKSLLRALERQAAAPRRRAARPDAAMLAMMGIGVKRVKAQGARRPGGPTGTEKADG